MHVATDSGMMAPEISLGKQQIGGITVIEVKNITKKYGSFTAVDNISFTIQDGEIVGFLGQNGAGKSTTMNMITGYIEPTEGTIMVNGFDIMKKTKQAKKQIGYMPESVPSYAELTVKEFVRYMAELKMVKRAQRKQEVEKVLKETGLEDVQNKLIRNLSRGYKQRVSLAGALVGNPDVLILDEPTVGLDPKQVTEIRSLIKSLGKDHTVILSSHILPEVSQICEKVIIINKGKIIAVDTPENLESKVQEKNVLHITVGDKNANMEQIKETISEIEELTLVKDNQDGTKQYTIVTAKDVDLRKKLFDELPKKDIMIFELKKAEATLEDAFMKLVNAVQEEKKEDKKESKKKEKQKKKEEKKLEKEKQEEVTVEEKVEEQEEAKNETEEETGTTQIEENQSETTPAEEEVAAETVEENVVTEEMPQEEKEELAEETIDTVEEITAPETDPVQNETIEQTQEATTETIEETAVVAEEAEPVQEENAVEEQQEIANVEEPKEESVVVEETKEENKEEEKTAEKVEETTQEQPVVQKYNQNRNSGSYKNNYKHTKKKHKKGAK